MGVLPSDGGGPLYDPRPFFRRIVYWEYLVDIRKTPLLASGPGTPTVLAYGTPKAPHPQLLQRAVDCAGSIPSTL